MSVDSTFATLYRPPIAFLPASSTIPPAGQSHLNGTLHSAFQPALTMADGLLARLQKDVITLPQIEGDLSRLEDNLGILAEWLAPWMQPLWEKTGEEADRAAHQIAIDDFGALMAAACAVYDDYFAVARAHPMAFWQFTGQVVHTSQALLADLPYTLLDRTQLAMLIAALGQMLGVLAVRLPMTGDTPISSPFPPYAPGEEKRARYRQCWQTGESGDWSQRVALYRWKTGHHFFDLCAIFCGDALRRAQAAIAEEDENRGVAELGLAESFLRGTTAAMWYAGDFPANLYRDFVRPSMVMPGRSSGFSGDQNADYNRMKDAKAALKAFLCQNYGQTLADLPPRLLWAFLSVHEADIEDNEHHLLIAAHKVGMDQSLAQKEWQDELPSHVHRQKAVDVLRKMAERKRQEFAAL